MRPASSSRARGRRRRKGDWDGGGGGGGGGGFAQGVPALGRRDAVPGRGSLPPSPGGRGAAGARVWVASSPRPGSGSGKQPIERQLDFRV
jgi:hypothetical protein